ncbi:isoprenylcysteine carboxyl methyltransferase family protein [Anoxybacillus amylolyticus]|uniref:Isoprenylcysteine carboxyl methyltransferase family protein n=1 Tax=Anoxybacteroides amylolyticum TaxID=294699 RepID=A0A160F4K9_9BACL|nr:isoprenylcysteine carboxyl methyltransferase family protein [Anoxybacillus amylolyticus]
MLYVFFLFIVCMRVGELLIAKRNERIVKAMGAKEFGQAHYRWIVLLHVAFLFSFFIEALMKGATLSSWWPFLLPLFFAVQLLRIWALFSLGVFWNTKILVVPNVIVQKGPYRFLRHPNYVVVVLEILLIPLLFRAYITALVFSLLNAYLLSIRIPVEERALAMLTNYKEFNRPRFFPAK